MIMTKEYLKIGMYVRTSIGTIGKIKTVGIEYVGIEFEEADACFVNKEKIITASDNIIDLVECADLLVIEDAMKDINGNNVRLFNPVRCDGFTTFENNQHCMIINMDYIIPIENIKITQILTHEQFKAMSYKVGE